MIYDYCLLQSIESAGRSYLSVTPSVVAAALAEGAGESIPADAAAADLVASVADAYRLVVRCPQGLWAFADRGPNGVPLSVAFLAASVLAAYEMRGDEAATARAYYLRLAWLLDCGMSAGLPVGFETDDFDDLWDHLAGHLSETAGRELALPDPGTTRTHIARPLAHVPLRRVDIAKLPDFFDWAGFEPGRSAPPQELDAPFERWASTRGRLSRSGRSAMADERRGAVTAQVAQELESWDGSSTDARGRQSASVQILLDFVRRQPALSFLPRRPPFFPEILEWDGRRLEAGVDGWYEPIDIEPEDGQHLLQGWDWRSTSAGRTFKLYRRGSSVIALRPAGDYTGFLSQRGLVQGVACAVLCVAELESAVRDYLSDVSATACAAVDHPAVPDGWRLFPRVVAVRNVPPEPALEVLTVDSAVEILVTGGLRLGRRAAWLVGAPPRISVAGIGPGQEVLVDGHRVAVGEGGLLALDSALASAGSHSVHAGRVRRRVEMVEATHGWRAQLLTNGYEVAARPVALPSGSWTVIGAEPGQVTSASSVGRAGVIAMPSFDPVWAISVGPRGDSAVLALSVDPVEPRPCSTLIAPRIGSPVQAWTTAVYDASVRRARVGSLVDAGCEVDLRGAWRQYTATAKALKRRWRARR